MISQPSAAASELLTLRLGATAPSPVSSRSDPDRPLRRPPSHGFRRIGHGYIPPPVVGRPFASPVRPEAHSQRDDGENADDGSLESM